MPKKPAMGTTTEGLPAIPYADCGRWGELYPTIASYMVDSTWEDGTPRKPAKLFNDIDHAGWRLTLKEPNLNLKVSVVTATPDDMYAALEAVLNAPVVPWVADLWSPGASNGKKK